MTLSLCDIYIYSSMGQQQAGMEMGKMVREEEQHLQVNLVNILVNVLMNILLNGISW